MKLACDWEVLLFGVSDKCVCVCAYIVHGNHASSAQHTHTPGPLTMVKGSKEIPCTGLLFKTYFAIADRPSGSGEGVHLRVLEYGMIPLGTALLHKSVDIEGQAMQPDLQSGMCTSAHHHAHMHMHPHVHTCAHM